MQKLDKRSITSRLNAQKSTGPKTPEGKLRAATNAVTHGAYARSLILPGEDLAEFQRLIERNFLSWKPTDIVEELLVTDMAATLWRMRRQAAAEASLIDIQIKRMTPMFNNEFEFISGSGLYTLAASALNQHGDALSQITRQGRRLLAHYQKLCQQLFTLRKYLPPVTPSSDNPEEHPTPPTTETTTEEQVTDPQTDTTADASPGGEAKLSSPPNPIPIAPENRVSNPQSVIYAALPPLITPAKSSGAIPHLVKAASAD